MFKKQNIKIYYDEPKSNMINSAEKLTNQRLKKKEDGLNKLGESGPSYQIISTGIESLKKTLDASKLIEKVKKASRKPDYLDTEKRFQNSDFNKPLPTAPEKTTIENQNNIRLPKYSSKNSETNSQEANTMFNNSSNYNNRCNNWQNQRRIQNNNGYNNYYQNKRFRYNKPNQSYSNNQWYLNNQRHICLWLLYSNQNYTNNSKNQNQSRNRNQMSNQNQKQKMKLPPLEIPCKHCGSTEHWDQGCKKKTFFWNRGAIKSTLIFKTKL